MKTAPKLADLAGDADIASQCESKSAAMRVPIDRGNHGLAQSVDLFEQAGHEFLGGKRAHQVTAGRAEQRPNGGAVGGIRISRTGLDVCTGAK